MIEAFYLFLCLFLLMFSSLQNLTSCCSAVLCPRPNPSDGKQAQKHSTHTAVGRRRKMEDKEPKQFGVRSFLFIRGIRSAYTRFPKCSYCSIDLCVKTKLQSCSLLCHVILVRERHHFFKSVVRKNNPRRKQY